MGFWGEAGGSSFLEKQNKKKATKRRNKKWKPVNSILLSGLELDAAISSTLSSSNITYLALNPKDCKLGNTDSHTLESCAPLLFKLQGTCHARPHRPLSLLSRKPIRFAGHGDKIPFIRTARQRSQASIDQRSPLSWSDALPGA
jgi:hypothetical protein